MCREQQSPHISGKMMWDNEPEHARTESVPSVPDAAEMFRKRKGNKCKTERKAKREKWRVCAAYDRTE